MIHFSINDVYYVKMFSMYTQHMYSTRVRLAMNIGIHELYRKRDLTVKTWDTQIIDIPI